MRNIPSHYGEQWYIMGVGAEVLCSAKAGVRGYTSISSYLEWMLNSVNTNSSN